MRTNRIIALAAALTMAATAAQARHLSPQEALSLAMENTQMKKSAASGAESFSLARTIESPISAKESAYVFDAPSGFVVLATDDTMESLVLGYADEGTFSDAEQAPGLQWWLEAIAAAVDMEAGANEPNGASSSPRIAAAISDRADVEPMLTTKWGQDAPYNDMCPLVNGKRTMTGCVATALAQIMKYHNWPPKGEGEYSYTSSNGVSASANFGATTYRWGDMLDEYDRNSSASAKSAVAEIMYHCGVASEAKYGVDATGAQDLLAALGVYRHLPMSKSMTIQKSIWYEREVWDEMLYEQIAEGTPVYMSGTNRDGGHAFVLDGYKEGLYHVNWGWNGYGNGYFGLRTLNPNGGEGIQDTSYNGYKANAILNARAPREGDTVIHQVALDDQYDIEDRINAKLKKVWEKSNEYFPCLPIQINPAHFNYSLEPSSLRFGLHIFNQDEDYWILAEKEDFEILEPYTGYGTLKIPSDNFPLGEWDAWPAYQAEGEEWQEMQIRFNKKIHPLHYISEEKEVWSPGREVFQPEEFWVEQDTFITTIKNTLKVEAQIRPYDCYNQLDFITSTTDKKVATGTTNFNNNPYPMTFLKTKYRGEAKITVKIKGTELADSFIVKVIGYEQNIKYSPIDSILAVGTSINLNATATSGLPVSYSVESIDNATYAMIEDNILTTLEPGEFLLRLEQAGDTIYEPAAIIEQRIVVKSPQTIIWDQDFTNIEEGSEVELTAESSSSLEISYEILSGKEYASIDNSILRLLSSGEITIEASQFGNEKYFPADPVARNIKILAGNPPINNSQVLIKTTGNTLMVENLPIGEQFVVSDAIGRIIYRGNCRTVPLTPGIYFVIIGNTAKKIVIN